jgi:hypothetical protein
VGYQLSEASAKLGQIGSGVKGFKQTDAVQNLEAFDLAQFVQRKRVLGLANYQEVMDNSIGKESL